MTGIDGRYLRGFGWDLETDTEVPFTVDLSTGEHTGGAGDWLSESVAIKKRPKQQMARAISKETKTTDPRQPEVAARREPHWQAMHDSC